jgi:hypothetical protein
MKWGPWSQLWNDNHEREVEPRIPVMNKTQTRRHGLHAPILYNRDGLQNVKAGDKQEIITDNAIYIICVYIHCIYCHVYEWLQKRFGLAIGFTEYLQIVIKSNSSAITNSHTQHVVSLLSLLCLHQSLSDNGFEGGRSPYSLFPNYLRASATRS